MNTRTNTRFTHPRILVAAAIAFVFSLAAPAFGLQPLDLKCEHRTDPLGIDIAQPRLSWTLKAASKSARAERQRAYQIMAASSQEKLRHNVGDLWDSGKVEDSRSVLVPYAGKPLASGQHCFWKVKVWDQAGRESSWSRPAHWSMGLLKRDDWKAQWIGLDEPESKVTFANASWIWFPEGAPEKAAPLGTAFFRREFRIPPGRVVSSAKWLIAGDNSARAFVNGKEAGSNANFKAVTALDIAAFLNEERNVLAVAVENGGSGPNPAGLIGRVEIQFDSGEPLVIATDAQWRSTLEKFDNWEARNFDDSTWLAALVIGPVGMQPWGEIGMPENRVLPARHLRKDFEIVRTVSRATIWCSGLGLSELYVNGKRTDDDVLSPALTEYNKRVFYVTRDVTGFVRRGANTLGVLLGNGRFYAPRSSVPISTRSYGFPKLLLQLKLEYADGSSELIVSDESWDLSTEGPIRENNEYDGEVYDARMELAGWSQPGGFERSGQWMKARRVSAPEGELRAQMIEPIRVTETLKPISMKEVSPGTFIYDMGQNMVGWCRMRVSGPAGTVVRLRHAETLKPDGTLYMDNIRGAKVTDTYILKGGRREFYEPRFTYHGFRFVEITGFPGRPSLDSIEGRVVHDDMERTGHFACSSHLLNKVITNTVWGFRGNYRSIPTDCPQRDERQGWLGDRSEVSRGETYIHNTAAFHTKWTQDMADAQNETGSVPDVCPSYWPLYNDNVTWPSSIAMIPGTLRQQYGDLAPIERIYPAAKKWLDHMSGYITNGIISRDNYGDWCVPPEDPLLIHSKDPARKTDPALLASAYLYWDARLLSHYATLLGKTEDSQNFDQLADRLREGILRKFYSEEKGYFANGSQTSCVLPLAFGLVPDSGRDKVLNRLIEKISSESRDHVGTGLIGAQWLMRTLTRNGYGDVAWRIATQDTYPSWGYMVRKGATTIWELWNGDTADPAMNSGNHVMLVGDLVAWAFEDLAGIQPDAQTPGFARINMRPELPGGCDWVRASYKSPHGVVLSEWNRAGDRFTWKLVVPPNTTARLSIPAGAPESIRESGKALARAKGARPVAFENGRQVVEVGSGRYTFRSQL